MKLLWNYGHVGYLMLNFSGVCGSNREYEDDMTYFRAWLGDRLENSDFCQQGHNVRFHFFLLWQVLEASAKEDYQKLLWQTNNFLGKFVLNGAIFSIGNKKSGSAGWLNMKPWPATMVTDCKFIVFISRCPPWAPMTCMLVGTKNRKSHQDP